MLMFGEYSWNSTVEVTRNFSENFLAHHFIGPEVKLSGKDLSSYLSPEHKVEVNFLLGFSNLSIIDSDE